MRTALIVCCILIFTFITYPLRILHKILYRERAERFKLNYKLLRKLTRMVLCINGARIKTTNLHLSKIDMPVLFVSNHKSNMDSVILISLIDTNFIFIGKRELSRVPIIGAWFRDIGSIFLDREDLRASLNSIIKAQSFLEKGASVLIYPEGKRISVNELDKFKAGSFKLATKSNVPVVPIAIKGSAGLLENKKIFASANIDIAFGEMICPDSEMFSNTVNLSDYAQKKVQEMYANFD